MYRLMTLLWLRWEYLISNRFLLVVCVATPFVDFAILQAIPMIHGELYFLNMGLSLIYGMTAGYYDRYLSDFEGETVSTVYPCQKHDFQPDNYDIPVKEVVTCK